MQRITFIRPSLLHSGASSPRPFGGLHACFLFCLFPIFLFFRGLPACPYRCATDYCQLSRRLFCCQHPHYPSPGMFPHEQRGDLGAIRPWHTCRLECHYCPGLTHVYFLDLPLKLTKASTKGGHTTLGKLCVCVCVCVCLFAHRHALGSIHPALHVCALDTASMLRF